MQPLHFLQKLSIGLALITALPVAAQTVTLDSLPKQSQEEISQVCLPVQFREGAGAYRNCVQAELDLRANGSSNNMAKLSFDDKYAVQQACAKAGGQSSSAYQSCVTDQVTALNKISTPAFTGVSEDELYVVQQTCFEAQSKLGAAQYRQCINSEVENLTAIPAVDTSQLNMLNKNALQLRCSAIASTAMQYRQCIAAEFSSIAGSEPTFLPVSNATKIVRTSEVEPRVVVEEPKPTARPVVEPKPAARPAVEPIVSADSTTSESTMVMPRNIEPQRSEVDTLSDANGDVLKAIPTPKLLAATDNVDIQNAETSNSTPRVISRPNLVNDLEQQRRAEAQGIELENSPTTATASNLGANAQPDAVATGLWQKFLDSLASLGSIGWLIIAAVLALPALLLGVFSVIRRVKQPAMAHSQSNHNLTEQVQLGAQTRLLKHEREADEMFGERAQSTAQPDTASNAVDEPDAVAEHDAVTRFATKDSISHLKQQSSSVSNFAWQSAFGHWLSKQPESNKMELSIEFLIYWIAYGDERYGPELKKRLFTTNDLNTHDQIKRWVLKQDVFAFSDVVGWLRTNASQTQLEQCIALIMALLVTENSVTPVQNTMLRFLSDMFNTGKEALEQNFEQAFGHALPAMPRTDNENWWVSQSPTAIQSWNAREIASRPELEQLILRLGLGPGFNDTDVIEAFRRAARRCHPDRFSDLGARERALAEQRFTKFQDARDKLLGVSV